MDQQSHGAPNTPPYVKESFKYEHDESRWLHTITTYH